MEAGITSNALAFAAVAGFLILGWVLFLYRRGKLREDHTLLWISVAAAIILLSTWTGLLLAINQIVGAANVSEVVLAAFVAFLIIVSIYFSVRLSELTERNKIVAQQLAVLNLTNTLTSPERSNDKKG